MIDYQINKILNEIDSPNEKLEFLQSLMNFIQKKAAPIQERIQNPFLEIVNEEPENRNPTEEAEEVPEKQQP